MAREYASEEYPYTDEVPRIARQERAAVTLLIQMPDGSLSGLRKVIGIIRRSRAKGITSAEGLRERIDTARIMAGGPRKRDG